jgi:hypothetical protein
VRRPYLPLVNILLYTFCNNNNNNNKKEKKKKENQKKMSPQQKMNVNKDISDKK